nr:cell division inhibitor [uncultured bacterium]
MRRIVIPGGSGCVGELLARHFYELGDQVTVLSRTPRPAPWAVAAWSGRELGEWVKAIDGADVVINLAGRSVDCRYTWENRREIMNSRVESTRTIGKAIAQVSRPPALWINASTATIYRHSLDREMDEASGELGGAESGAQPTWKFSTDVARAWEAAFFGSATPGTRKVATRSAIVMIPGASWLRKLTDLMHWGLGGTEGPGTQFMSWIHQTDFVRAIEFLILRQDLQGAVNICSPNPLPNREFLRELRRAYGVHFGPPLPEWTLRIGSILLRTEAELVLKSRRVVPGRLLEAGFEFRYADWEGAIRDLARRSGVSPQNQRRHYNNEVHGES